jgi:PIN domain nuclease of toxin-antitoxin system
MEWRRRLRVLLDTHTLVWATSSTSSLSRQASQIIVDHSNVVFVSAASAWEIATKVRLGKFPEAEELERDFLSIMDRAGYTLIPIDAATALRAGRLAAAHGDPFDRMIAAQALANDIPVLSADGKLDVFGIRRIW